jgi:hypothetical protein
MDSVVPRRTGHRAFLASFKSQVLVMTDEADRTFPLAETGALTDWLTTLKHSPKCQFAVVEGYRIGESLDK